MSEGVLTLAEFRPFTIERIDVLSHNTKLIRFTLPEGVSLNLPVSSCISVQGFPGGSTVARPYTPVSHSSDVGFFDLVIKVYPQGALTQHINSLNVGDKLEMKGPIRKIEYKANMKKHIGMIAGGTGITPMYQVIREIISNPEDKTEVSLLFANVSPQDIIMHGELEAVAKAHPNIHIHYVVNKGDETWTGSVGFVSAELIKQYLPAPADDSMVFVCGPPAMVSIICGSKGPNFTQGEVDGVLKDLGYTSAHVFKF
eukprot:c3733_g1_i1.p1 GENE.c3733_g1_i1~~c3733_g1_i1.p1  ORF type:complete len:272 (+),score=69.56 c3733_g1_i1:51-818(+)